MKKRKNLLKAISIEETWLGQSPKAVEIREAAKELMEKILKYKS